MDVPAQPAQPAHAIRCLKAAGARSVWLVERPGEGRRTVKSWPLTAALAFKWALGQSQPQRHVRAARRLAAAGISTPRVVAGPAWTRRAGPVRLSLELDHMEGRTALEVLQDGDPACIRGAAEAIGAMLRRLIAARLFNRDLKMSNVLVAPGPRGWTACLLDPVGVRRMTDVRGQTARMVERLGVEAREQGVGIPAEARRAVIDAARSAVGPGAGSAVGRAVPGATPRRTGGPERRTP